MNAKLLKQTAAMLLIAITALAGCKKDPVEPETGGPDPVVPANRATGVNLDKDALALSVGDTAKLTATVAPANASNKDITWSITDVTVAIIADNGTVIALKPGTATIAVTTDDGGFNDECTVTVTPAGVGAELSVSPSAAISLASAGGTSAAITVTTNQPAWDVASSQAWCTVSKSGNTFTVTAAAHTGTEARTATITVSAGSAANIVLQVKQEGSVFSEDPNLKKAAYCLAYIYQVTEKKKQGQSISSISGICSVTNQPNGTINYTSFSSYTALVPFLYNTPLVMGATPSSSRDNVYAARWEILNGTYDYANDPANIFAYFGTYSGRLFFSAAELGGNTSTLTKMQKAANNDAITVDVLNNVSYPNNSYKILIFGKNKAGALIGKYIGYTTNGTSFTYWRLDPDDVNFGKSATVAIP